MRTRFTPLVISLIAITTMLFSSCSTSNFTSSSNPHYHLSLVKADRTLVKPVTRPSTASDAIEPIAQHRSSMPSSPVNDPMQSVSLLSKTDINKVNAVNKSSNDNVSPVKKAKVNTTINALAPGNETQKHSLGNSFLTRESYQASGSNTFAILALVFGILALIAYYGAFLFAVLAIIFGIIALNHGENRTMAWLGIIFGIVGILIWGLVIVVVV